MPFMASRTKTAAHLTSVVRCWDTVSAPSDRVPILSNGAPPNQGLLRSAATRNYGRGRPLRCRCFRMRVELPPHRRRSAPGEWRVCLVRNPPRFDRLEWRHRDESTATAHFRGERGRDAVQRSRLEPRGSVRILEPPNTSVAGHRRGPGPRGLRGDRGDRERSERLILPQLSPHDSVVRAPTSSMC